MFLCKHTRGQYAWNPYRGIYDNVSVYFNGKVFYKVIIAFGTIVQNNIL